jgi:hypothetical protein
MLGIVCLAAGDWTVLFQQAETARKAGSTAEAEKHYQAAIKAAGEALASNAQQLFDSAVCIRAL